MFTREDARWLSETTGRIYTAQTVQDYTAATMSALDRKFHLHTFACEELGAGESTYQLHKLRCGAPAPEDHTAFFHDFPMISAMGAAKPPPVIHMRRDVPGAHWERT